MIAMNTAGLEVFKGDFFIKVLKADTDNPSIVEQFGNALKGAIDGMLECYLNALDALALAVKRGVIPVDVVRDDYGKVYADTVTKYSEYIGNFPEVVTFSKVLSGSTS